MSKKHIRHQHQQGTQNQVLNTAPAPQPISSKPESTGAVRSDSGTTNPPTPVQDNNRHWPKWSAIAATAAATFSFFALIAYTVVSSSQLTLTRNSNEAAYRAWLTVKQVRDAPPIVVGSLAPLTAEIENTGRSPASNVQVVATTAYAPLDWSIPDRAPGSSVKSGVIGPGQIRSVTFSLKAALTQADVDAINSGKQRVYWFADVAYEDQFSTDRLLKFCFFYTPPPKGLSVVSYPVCPSHEFVK